MTNYKIFVTAYIYPDGNRKFQDCVKYNYDNVVHPEDKFQPIKNKFRRLFKTYYQLDINFQNH